MTTQFRPQQLSSPVKSYVGFLAQIFADLVPGHFQVSYEVVMSWSRKDVIHVTDC